MEIKLDPLDFDIYRTLIIRQRIFIKSLLREISESEYGVSTALNAVITNYTSSRKLHLSSEEIIMGIYSRDKATFKYIVDESYSQIKRLVINNKGNVQDAEDVFSSAIEELIKIVDRGNFALHSSIAAYLYTIAKNLWASANNNKPREPKDFDDLNKSKKPNKPERPYRPIFIPLENKDIDKIGTLFSEEMVTDEYPEDYEVIKKCLGYFSGVCQELLREYYLNEQDWKQVAEILGYTNAESAKQQTYKCKKSFIKNIETGKVHLDEKLINPKYLTKIQASKYLEVSGKTINHLLESGKIASVTVNGKIRYTKDELNLYIRNLNTDFAFCNKSFIKLDLVNQTYFPFEWVTLYPIIHQNRSWIYLYRGGWGKVKFSMKEFNKYFSYADEIQKLAFKFNIFI